MSFSRAPLKRFNENVGCGPPLGCYDVKDDDHVKGPASFHKSDRFKPVGAAAAAPPMPPPSPSKNVPMSPVRRSTSVDGIVGGSCVKREKSGITMEMKRQMLLEKEIRSLVQQRGKQDQRVLVLEEELKRVESKLLAAVREKTGLSAGVTTLERQLAELKKANNFLKNKVSADKTKEKINSLTMELMDARNKLDAKDKELRFLQLSTEGQVKLLETDLKAATATQTALGERNKDLEDLHHATKTQNEELESEIEELQAVIYGLRGEIKALQGYLDTANDQIQDLRLKLREKNVSEQTVSDSQQGRLGLLEGELEQRTAELQNSQRDLKQKEDKCQQELQASQDALRETEKALESRKLELESSQKTLVEMEARVKQANQEVEAYQGTAQQQEAELTRLREVLRRTERELDEGAAHLGERCVLLEEDRSRTEEEGLRRVQELETELSSLKEVKSDESEAQMQLQQACDALTGEVEKEKALADSLSVLLGQEREESEERLRTLRDEMEEVLGELSVMEEQEQRWQETVEKSQEALQSMQQQNACLERRLSEARAQLGSKSSDAETLGEKLLAATRELQEEHADSLGKIGALATELESTKQALRGAEERRRELEEEVERVSQKMKDEMDRVIQQKEEMKRVKDESEEQQKRHLTAHQTQEKAREEYTRILLDVQTRLAQKDEKIKAMETSHAALTSQMQDEMQKQRREKGEVLGQLEQQRDQNLARVQREKEDFQRLLGKTREEKEEMINQLQQEREEKCKLQTLLQEERGAREMEMKDSQQRGISEVFTLQTRLEKVDEERRGLHSQLELLDQDKLALQDQLEKTEQDRLDLRSRLERDVLSLQMQVELVEEGKRGLQEELEKGQLDKRVLRERVEVLTQEKVALQWEMEEERQELARQLAETHDNGSSSAEMEHWRKQYDELFAKVKPFQEQLNGFAAERDVLLNENGANQGELNRLSDAYARLLGHQNHKQKIRHVVKLKDENITLKQELSKLRSQVSRQTKELEQLKTELPGAPCRKFDHSKAFQHDRKENQQPRATTALKEGNRC